MSAEPENEVPEGAAVLPEIPPELGVHPLLLAVLHAIVFVDGSAEDMVNPDAGAEALEYLAGYLQRLGGADLRRVQEDMRVLTVYARDQDWPKPVIRFFKDFLSEFGAGEQDVV
jgi:hypothetical protein